MINLVELMNLINRSGIELSNNSKFHFAQVSNDFALKEPLRAFSQNRFNEWQEMQTRRYFHIGSEIVSLIQKMRGGDEWLFAGVYAVDDCEELNPGEREQTWYPQGVPRKYYKYSLRKLDGLEELVGNIVQFNKTFRQSYPFIRTIMS